MFQKECRPGGDELVQTIIESFAKSTVSNTDRCQEYQGAACGSIYEVSPMMAAADTATNLLRPLRDIRKEAGHMLQRSRDVAHCLEGSCLAAVSW